MRIAFAAATALALVAALPPAPEPPPQVTGTALAEELGCGACHEGMPAPAVVRARAPALGPDAPPLDPEFVFTYLADPIRRRDNIGASRMPDFRLDEAERVALARHLGSGPLSGAVARAAADHPEADAELGGRIFGVLGCAGCHQADGGPERIGPDLSREGARVRDSWLRDFLRDPVPVRTAAHPEAPGARMPDFRLSEGEVDALAAYLSSRGTPTAQAPEALTPFKAQRTEHLVTTRLACLGCHKKDGVGGRVGPPLDGISERLRPGFVVEMIRDPASAAASRSMPRQRMPPTEAGRVARWLLDDEGPWEGSARVSLADPAHPAWGMYSTAAAEGDAPDGAALYARHCAACHGAEGDGAGWNAADLPVPPTAHADAELMARRPDDALFDGIYAGAFVLDGSPRMPPFGDLLTRAQIEALVAHIRTLCACEQPAWADDGGRE